MKNSRLLTIFLIVFVDLLGFGLILPLLPYYAETYGATARLWGAGGLLCGSAACRRATARPPFGPRGPPPGVIDLIAGTFLGFLLLAWLTRLAAGLPGSLIRRRLISPSSLCSVSRILDGLTGGNMTVAQAYITDVTMRETAPGAWESLARRLGLASSSARPLAGSQPLGILRFRPLWPRVFHAQPAGDLPLSA